MNELDAELQNYMMAIQAKRALIQWLRLWRLFLERQCRWKTSPAGWFGYCRSGWQDEWGLQEYVAGGVRVSRQVVLFHYVSTTQSSAKCHTLVIH